VSEPKHHETENQVNRPHVVIVGGGFGGLNAAKALADVDVSVTVLDRRNHHVFQPLLYEVATAGLNPSDIAFPIRSVLRRQRNTRVLLAEVVGIDVDARTVMVTDGAPIAFDYLVLASGATHSYFGHEEWEQLAPGLKTIEDATEMRGRILTAFELAERADDPQVRERLLTFVIIGAGPTGVELAGSIAGIATRAMTQDFRSIDPSSAHIILLEGADRILGTYSPKLSRKAQDQLEALGVVVKTSTMVTAVDEHGVDTTIGRIESSCVLWAAGVAASPLGSTLGVETDRSGRVIVEPDLAIPGDPFVFVIGDLAHIGDGENLIPGVAPAAMQQGRHVGAMIEADRRNEDRKPFHYKDKGSLAQVGRTAAVAHLAGLEFSGFVAWTLWWSIHIAYLIGFRSRILVLFGWGWSWLTYQRSARLITRGWRPRNDSTRRDDR
jgi:NADH:quinone reductase (non-electrogenic)